MTNKQGNQKRFVSVNSCIFIPLITPMTHDHKHDRDFINRVTRSHAHGSYFPALISSTPVGLTSRTLMN